MNEQRNLLSVDLGSVCAEALDELCKQTKRTRSDLVRDIILISYHFGLAKDFNTLRNTIEELSKGKHTPRTRGKISNEEKSVIDTYREVYSYKGRLYNPAVLGALRAVAKSVDYETIRSMIELSGNNTLVASILSRGERPSLQMLLAEKMVGQLLPLVDEFKAKEVKRKVLELEGHVKPLALTELHKDLDDNTYSEAFDQIQAAKTAKEVNDIKKAALSNELRKELSGEQ